MPNQEEAAQKLIFDFLKETSQIFGVVKKYSILIEELLPDNKAPIHAANELKSLVFHLYNSADHPEYVETNIIEAKEHLCRAFYDLHSMVISIYIKQISEKIKSHKLTTISEVCPEYSQIIRPSMRDIQENLREIRSNRNTDIALIQEGIKNFEDQTKALARYNDIIEGYFPDFAQYEEEKRKEMQEERGWDLQKIIITALISIAIGIGGFFLGKWYNSDKGGADTQQPKVKQEATH